MTASAGSWARMVRRLLRGLSLIAVLALLGSVAAVSLAALAAFDREVRPAIEREGAVIGVVVASPLERALGLGIPFEALVGVPAYLEEVAANHPSVSYLALTDLSGVALAAAGAAATAFHAAARPPLQPGEAIVRRALPGIYETALPVAAPGGRQQGWLLVGIGRAGVDATITDTRWDLAIVLLVAAMVTLELLRFAIDRAVLGPLAMIERISCRLRAGDCTVLADACQPDEAGRVARAANALQRRLADRWAHLQWLAAECAHAGAAAASEAAAVLGGVRDRLRLRSDGARPEAPQASAAGARLPLFLFVVAEQFSTSFIPLLGRDLAPADPALLSLDLLAALPISAFVATVAFATPWGGWLTARRGARAAVLVGGGIAGAGYLGAAMAADLAGFAIARMVCGIGYAVLTIACQAQMAFAASQGRLARSLGGFTGAVMSGAVCGTAIGAVIADRLGYAATFVASFGLVLVVMLVALRAIPGGTHAAMPSATQAAGAARTALGDRRFLALVLFAAVPAKIVLAGVIFYLAPLALREIGESQAAIGRNVMLYGLCMLPAIALGGWLADRTRAGATLVWGAALMNGAALLLVPALPVGIALPMAIAATGAAQGIASAPMLAAAAAGSAGSTALLLSSLRLAERIGSVLGPFAAAWLLARGGSIWAMAVLGAATAVAGLGYAVAQQAGRRAPSMRVAP